MNAACQQQEDARRRRAPQHQPSKGCGDGWLNYLEGLQGCCAELLPGFRPESRNPR